MNSRIRWYDESDIEKIRQEGLHRSALSKQEFLNSFDSNLKAYVEARSKFENDYADKVIGKSNGLYKSQPQALSGNAHERKAIQEQILKERERLKSLSDKLYPDSKWHFFTTDKEGKAILQKWDKANEIIMKKFGRKFFD